MAVALLLAPSPMMRVGVAAGPPERVIVVLRNDTADPATVAQELGGAHGFRASHIYRYALKGFAASIPAQALDAIRRNPQVVRIDSDLPVQAAGQTIPTGVSRIGDLANPTAAIDGVDTRV